MPQGYYPDTSVIGKSWFASNQPLSEARLRSQGYSSHTGTVRCSVCLPLRLGSAFVVEQTKYQLFIIFMKMVTNQQQDNKNSSSSNSSSSSSTSSSSSSSGNGSCITSGVGGGGGSSSSSSSSSSSGGSSSRSSGGSSSSSSSIVVVVPAITIHGQYIGLNVLQYFGTSPLCCPIIILNSNIVVQIQFPKKFQSFKFKSRQQELA